MCVHLESFIVACFFCLSKDTLRLLTLLFDYGHQSDMYEALHEGMRTIEIDNWLQVIPQLIARIDTPRPLVSRLIHSLLADLGKHHPQALVYSLTVACKSNNKSRRSAADKILSKIREHSESLVNQSLMASDELIRVAILWHEQWHEALEVIFTRILRRATFQIISFQISIYFNFSHFFSSIFPLKFSHFFIFIFFIIQIPSQRAECWFFVFFDMFIRKLLASTSANAT